MFCELAERRDGGKERLTNMMKTLVRYSWVGVVILATHAEMPATAQEIVVSDGQCDAADGNCRSLRRDRLELPYRHCDIPFGTSFKAIFQVQRNRGRAAVTVLYHFDFNDDDTLNRGGARRLARIADSLPSHPYPIIIESVASGAAHNAARKKAVLKSLEGQSFPVPDERVVTGRPPARGLHGLDAELIHEKMLILK